jgi:hypothetical protein
MNEEAVVRELTEGLDKAHTWLEPRHWMFAFLVVMTVGSR